MFSKVDLINLEWREIEPTEEEARRLFNGWNIKNVEKRGNSSSIVSLIFYMANKNKERVVEVNADALNVLLNVCYADLERGN